MPERVITFIQPARDRWDALEKTQKIRIFAVIAVVLVALVLTVFFTTRTTYQVAIRNLDTIDANQVSVMLEENEIRHRQIQDGLGFAVEVDQARVNDARVLIETRGLAPDRDFSYEDALDFSGIGATETITRNNLLRARQQDLEQAIMAMDGIIWARVELALPEANRFFIQTADPASAAITVRTTRRLTSQEGRGIATFVRNSVLGLELENVEVLDTDFNILFSGMAMEDEDSVLSDLQNIMASDRLQVTAQLRELFRTMFDTVEVATNLVYPQVIGSSEIVRFNAPDGMEEGGFVLTERTLNASAQGQQAAFAPGIDSNNLLPPTYPIGPVGDMRASQAEADRVFAIDEIRQVIQDLPNSFIREDSSVSLNLVNVITHSQEAMQRMANVNGENFTQEDWDLFVANTPTHQRVTNEDYLAAYVMLAQGATGISNVNVAVWNVPYFIDYVPDPVQVNQIVMFAILALLLALLAFGLIRRSQPEEDDEIEPELSVEDLLVSTQMEEAMEEELLESIGYEEGSEAKRKIDEFIEEKPEAAASLLRHWLNEAEV